MHARHGYKTNTYKINGSVGQGENFCFELAAGDF